MLTPMDGETLLLLKAVGPIIVTLLMNLREQRLTRQEIHGMREEIRSVRTEINAVEQRNMERMNVFDGRLTSFDLRLGFVELTAPKK